MTAEAVTYPDEKAWLEGRRAGIGASDAAAVVGVGQPNRDPIILGKLIDPRDPYRRRRVSFFIAWWLDTGTL